MATSPGSFVSVNCSIIAIDRGKVIPFQFAPSSLKDTKTAQYYEPPILGRSSPFKSYSHNGARQVSFSINFYANPEQGVVFPVELVKEKINTLLSLPYPDYSGFVIKRPSVCLLNLGDIIKNFRSVCKQVSVAYRDDVPWDLTKKLPFGATISLTFEECVDSPLDYSSIASGSFNNPSSSAGSPVATSYTPTSSNALNTAIASSNNSLFTLPPL